MAKKLEKALREAIDAYLSVWEAWCNDRIVDLTHSNRKTPSGETRMKRRDFTALRDGLVMMRTELFKQQDHSPDGSESS